MGVAGEAIGGGLRLADLLGALALACDLAHRMPPETALKDALLSAAFARRLGWPEEEVRDTYYLALLYNVGCMGPAEEVGRVSSGDDGSMRHTYGEADYVDMPQMVRLAVTELANQSGPLDRVRAVVSVMTSPREEFVTIAAACCEAASRLAERLGAGPNVARALNETMARWDGKVFLLPAAEGVSRIGRLTHLIRIAHIQFIGKGHDRRRRGCSKTPGQRARSDPHLPACSMAMPGRGAVHSRRDDGMTTAGSSTVSGSNRDHYRVPHKVLAALG